MAALLAIFFALPFSGRILFHNEIGPFNSFAQAFFHAHLGKSLKSFVAIIHK